ncbi:Fc.00g017340.m01.CDS01 [Cosmosporella sp. VM-42]
MPPRTRKRKASAGELANLTMNLSSKEFGDSYDAEEAAPKKTTRAPRKAPQKLRKNTSVAAETQDNTKPFFDQTSTARKKVNVNEAKKHIQKQGDDIVKFIEQQIEVSPSGFDKAMVDEEFAPDLSPVLPWMTSSISKSGQIPPKPPQSSAKEAMDEFQGILDTYETLNKQSTGIPTPTWMRWDYDARELGVLNSHVMGFATQTVNHTIMPGPHPASINPPESGDDIEKMAWDLAEEGRPKETEETWGMAAQGQVKAFTSVVRMLPKDPGSMGPSS